MPEDDEHERRALKLLLKSLQEAGIEERDTPRFTFPGNTDAYYRKDKYNNVEVEFYLVKMFSGDIRCTLGLRYLSEDTARMFPNDAEAVATLVAMLHYLKDVASGILTNTAHRLFERRRNITFKSLSASQRKNVQAARREFEASLLASIDYRYVQKQRDWEKEFRAVQEGRGGSGARLGRGERKSLHRRYDEIYKVAKSIKKDHDRMHERFYESQKRRERGWKQWQEFWVKHATDLYDQAPEFLALFARLDKPSASEVAYRFLALQTNHKVSYLRRLVAASRKKAQSNK